MAQNRFIEMLTRHRSWPWFFPGAAVVLMGVFWCFEAGQPSASPKDFRVKSELERAGLNLLQLVTLSNRIDRARLDYDAASKGEQTWTETILATWSIDSDLSRISAGTNLPLPFLAMPGVSSMSAAEQREKAKASRAKLDEATGRTVELLAKTETLIGELRHQQAESQRRQEWGRMVRYVVAGLTICAGLGTLLQASRKRK
jgi:hypothetical protein